MVGNSYITINTNIKNNNKDFAPEFTKTHKIYKKKFIKHPKSA